MKVGFNPRLRRSWLKYRFASALFWGGWLGCTRHSRVTYAVVVAFSRTGDGHNHRQGATFAHSRNVTTQNRNFTTRADLSRPESEGRWVAIYSGHRLHRGALETGERSIAGPLSPVPIAVLRTVALFFAVIREAQAASTCTSSHTVSRRRQARRTRTATGMAGWCWPPISR